MTQRGYWAKHMDGHRYWHEAPESETCDGSGYMHCYCGGDFCVCGNQGEVECYGCKNCEREWDDDLEEMDDDA